MQKFNICKLACETNIRNYSGEYRIFHFVGFGNKNHFKSDETTLSVNSGKYQPTANSKVSKAAKNTSKNPKKGKKTEIISTPSKKGSHAGKKPTKDVKNATQVPSSPNTKKAESTLSDNPQLVGKTLSKKVKDDKCLEQVPQPKSITVPPAECNVKKPEIPQIKLSDGYMMPMFGLGTWGSKPDQAFKAVKHAIKMGYRMIDCAHVYENEQSVGKAINETIKKSIVKRDELFITSKLWNTFHRPELVLEGCRRSLSDLNLTYLNLYLIHWPMGYKEGKELIPFDACGRILASRVDYVDTWKAMEDLVYRRLTRSIGISNFNKKQTERILNIAKIKPVVNQVECHPYLNQMRLMAYLKMKKIAMVAYSPLGSPARPWAKPDEPNLLDNDMIKSIAFHHGRTAAQICIRYQIQRGNVVIPKSVTPSRIESNFNVADFELDGHEMKIINKLERKLRLVPLSKLSSHPHYPFHDEY